MIRAVIFDIGGVLVDFRKEDFFRDRGYDEETTRRLVSATMDSSYWCELDRGVFTTEEIISFIAAETPELEREIRSCLSDLRGIVGRRDTAIPWIEELKGRGLSVYYLSNYSAQAYEADRASLDFLEHCDGGILSYRDRVIKPDPAIYELLLARYGLKGEECVFIDDTQRNLPMAEHFGIHTIRFVTLEDTKRQLEELLAKG